LLDENLHYSQQRKIYENNLQGLQEKFLIIETIDEQMLKKKLQMCLILKKL
jgi:RNA polymerase-interacting CarD/CdnL/TRCF family regulator